MIFLPPPSQLTSFARSTAFIMVRIEQVVWVSLGTMSATGKMLACLATYHVGLMGYWFQVSRSGTGFITAQMVKFQSIWDRAYQKLIGIAVGRNQLTIDPEMPIARGFTGTCPKPASLGLIDLGPESFLYCLFPSRHKQTAFHQHAAATRRVGCRRLYFYYTTLGATL